MIYVFSLLLPITSAMQEVERKIPSEQGSIDSTTDNSPINIKVSPSTGSNSKINFHFFGDLGKLLDTSANEAMKFALDIIFEKFHLVSLEDIGNEVVNDVSQIVRLTGKQASELSKYAHAVANEMVNNQNKVTSGIKSEIKKISTDSINTTHIESQKTISSLNKQVDSLRQLIKIYEVQLTKFNELYKNMPNKENELNRDLESKKRDLEDKKRELNILSNSISNLSKENNELKKRNTNLYKYYVDKEDYNKLKDLHEEVSAQHNEQAHRVLTIREEVSGEYNGIVQELQNSLNAVNENKMYLEGDIESLRVELNDKDSEIQNLTDQIKELQASMKVFDGTADEKQRNIINLNNQIQKLNTDIINITKERGMVVQNLGLSTSRIKKLEIEAKQLQTSIDKANEINTNLTNKLREYEDNIESITETLDSRNHRIEELEQKIEELTTALNEARQQKSDNRVNALQLLGTSQRQAMKDVVNKEYPRIASILTSLKGDKKYDGYAREIGDKILEYTDIANAMQKPLFKDKKKPTELEIRDQTDTQNILNILTNAFFDGKIIVTKMKKTKNGFTPETNKNGQNKLEINSTIITPKYTKADIGANNMNHNLAKLIEFGNSLVSYHNEDKFIEITKPGKGSGTSKIGLTSLFRVLSVMKDGGAYNTLENAHTDKKLKNKKLPDLVLEQNLNNILSDAYNEIKDIAEANSE